MIQVQALVRRYGALTALNGISFSASRGEIIGFLGPNGAGKTTTMKILTGVLAPSAGAASVGGFSVDDPRARHKIGYLPETAPVYREHTVNAYLHFVARIRRLKDRRHAVARAISRCGLDTMKNRPIADLSKGYRQRVGLAQAIIHTPDVLILDEPTSGLDPNQRLEIRTLIRELGQDRTVIFSSHILPEVQAVASRILIVHRGNLVADDTLAQLGGFAGFDLSVQGAPETAIQQALHRAGFNAKFEDDCFRLQTTADRGPDIAHFVHTQGWALHALTPRRHTLETVFRTLTEAV